MCRIIVLILLIPFILSAQSFKVFDIDTSDYPLMKAKFYSQDIDGKQLLNYSPNDFEITENGEPRKVISVSCPEITEEPISLVLAIDISGSMSGEGIIRLKESIKDFIDYIPNNGSELAIIAFNTENYFVSDFSTNKAQLKLKVENLNVDGGTDFNAAFIKPIAGALLTINNSKFQKRGIVIVTDGLAKGNEAEIIKTAKSQNTKIYSLIINYSAPIILENISNETGGKIFNNVITRQEFIESFIHASNDLQNGPCEIVWNGSNQCKKIVEISIKNKQTDLVESHILLLGDDRLVKIVSSNYFLSFGFTNIGEYRDTTITLNARNSDHIVSDIKIEPNMGYYEIITPLPLVIKEDEDIELIIRYNSSDFLTKYAKLTLITDYCDINIGLLSGIKTKKISTKTLELIHPNGGEVFIAGSDTVVTWRGISESEKVNISFSPDNGENWVPISDSSNNLSYNWTLPNISSDSCLVVIEQYLGEIDRDKLVGDILWSKTYGGSLSDIPSSIIETNGSGYIMAGMSNSITRELGETDNRGGLDSWITRINEKGEIIWSNNYGGTEKDYATSLLNSIHGGYIILGGSNSNDKDLEIPGNKGSEDVWIYKLTEDGDLIWSQTFGGKKFDYASSIIETVSGDLIVVGYSYSTDGDLSLAGNEGLSDIWIFKLDKDGNIKWSKTFGGTKEDYASFIIETELGNLILVGSTQSTDFNFKNLNDINDALIMSLTSEGDIEWTKFYGGTKSDSLISIINTADGGYLLNGISQSSDGDLAGTMNRSNYDYWFFKIDYFGEIIWSKNYGTWSSEYTTSIAQTLEGKYIITGYTNSAVGVIDGVFGKGSYDIHILGLSDLGDIEWTKAYGGSGADYSTNILENSKGNIVVLGISSSEDGDLVKYQNKGAVFSWLLELSSGPSVPFQSDTSDAVFSIIMPEPVIQNNDIDMGEMIVGSTKDTIASSVICNIGDAPLHVLGVDITGGDTGDFIILRGAGDFYLEKDSCQDMMFEFTPSALGNRTVVATIRTTIGDFIDTIQIRGVGINSILEANTTLVDFGVFELGNGKDTIVALVKNVGNKDILITDTRISGPDLEQFTLKTSPTNYIIKAGDEKEFNLNYTARYGGRTSSILEMHYDGVGSPLRSMLFAEGVGGVVYPSMQDAYVGEVVDLKIFLDKIKPEGISKIATNFISTVSYNSTLLAPLDKSIPVTTRGDKSYIGYSGALGGANQIAAIPMKVGLGTAVKSGLVITEFQLYDDNGDSVDYEIEPGVGEFNVLGICEEGGLRLINPNGQAVELIVTTDGLNNNARINLTLIESGQTDLILFDQIGNKVETIYSGIPNAGQKELNLDLSKYTNGRYYIKLTTPTINKTEIIEVVR